MYYGKTRSCLLNNRFTGLQNPRIVSSTTNLYSGSLFSNFLIFDSASTSVRQFVKQSKILHRQSLSENLYILLLYFTQWFGIKVVIKFSSEFDGHRSNMSPYRIFHFIEVPSIVPLAKRTLKTNFMCAPLKILISQEYFFFMNISLLT